MVLLAWTAFDLANPECCLQDQAGAAAWASGAIGTTQDPQPAVDDCFCCARCVDTGTRIPELRTFAAWIDFAEPVRSLTTRPSSLYHPPRNNA
jgi:hypothetical protein